MIAMERGRRSHTTLAALTLLGTLGTNMVMADTPGRGRAPVATSTDAPRTPQNAGESARFRMAAVPVNPSDPIAIVNKQMITRQQLADESIARKGEEILETMIARTLIDQALRANKLEVTPAEVDAEIDNVAKRVAGIGREAWLRTLAKERNISPIQYARDIIYPSLALRKLAAARVQVTPADLNNAFEALYGDKLRCRMIMVDKVQTAKEIWEKLRTNANAFEKIAREQSMDTGSRALGGLMAEPISRHAYPQTVSDAAFYQLVDGDPKDTDPSHKPKDGDFTGPIQVAEATWVILRREELVPAQKADRTNDAIKKQTYDMIYEVKLKEAMGDYMVDLMKAAEIDNKLTGQVKMANQEVDFDQEVKLMGNRPAQRNDGPAPGQRPTPANTPTGAPSVKVPPPAALSPEVVKQTESLTRPPADRKK